MALNVPRLADTFQHAGVATAYACRPPYPAEVIDLLAQLATAMPRQVLDLGAGDGALARPLAERVDRVDAVEISAAMVEAGRRRPGGQRANLHWFVEPAEEIRLSGPYSLVAAGASLHWMDVPTVFARIGPLLAPGAMLAIVDQSYHRLAWHRALVDVIVRHSRNPAYNPQFSLPDDLVERGLFTVHGRYETPPAPFTQSARDYIEQFHSTASLARELMSPAEAARFDEEVAAVVRPYESDQGDLRMRLTASVVWGRTAVRG